MDRAKGMLGRAFGTLGGVAVRHISTVRCYATISASRAPARAGDLLTDIDTPALLLDLDAFERNCSKLRRVMEQYPGVAVRPHAKAHKCPEVALKQLELLGASGVCCQKVIEAEAMCEGGVVDVLVSNQVVAPRKLERLAGLAAAGARIAVCCDSPDNLRAIAAAAAASGTSLDVLVELNVGQDRCGVDTLTQLVDVARAATALDAVRFVGLQAYHGGLQHVRDPYDRAHRVGQVVARTREAVSALHAAGIPCPTVTGGGSGTYRLEAGSGIFTEVQPGSFAFNDADYCRNSQEDGSVGEWEQSLWVLTQVMSVSPSRALAVVDAGTKALATDSGPPRLLPPLKAPGDIGTSPLSSSTAGDLPAVLQPEYVNAGDEHGKLLWPQGVYQLPPPVLPALGALIKLQPGHCDPTVNLYDWIVAVRNVKQDIGSGGSEVGGGVGGLWGEVAGDEARVEAVWAVRGRGPGQ